MISLCSLVDNKPVCDDNRASLRRRKKLRWLKSEKPGFDFQQFCLFSYAETTLCTIITNSPHVCMIHILILVHVRIH